MLGGAGPPNLKSFQKVRVIYLKYTSYSKQLFMEDISYYHW